MEQNQDEVWQVTNKLEQAALQALPVEQRNRNTTVVKEMSANVSDSWARRASTANPLTKIAKDELRRTAGMISSAIQIVEAAASGDDEALPALVDRWLADVQGPSNATVA